VITLSPPLIAGETELDEIGSILRSVLTDASDAMVKQLPR
jgi:adenosylmethionine-8-amino-7-oxononanoate aminotransferase